MKRIGQIILGVVMVLTFVAIIYFGIMVVLADTLQATKVSCSQSLFGTDAKSTDSRMKKLTGGANIVIEQELAQEKKIATYVDDLMKDMTLDQKLAQMMILTNEHDIIASNLTTYQPGGIIFFEVDFKNKTIATVRNRVDILQSYMQIPLLVGVDEEGGEVSRLKTLAENGLPDFEGARVLSGKGMDAVISDTELKMQYLKELGMNLNFAPVADVVENQNSYMYLRSASGDATVVAQYVQNVLAVMKKQQVIGCVKHFPGYGDNVNTHAGIASDNKTLSEYQERDFIPFQAGMDVGVDMVMVSHIIMNVVDSENPASLSTKVHNMLREDMAYEGIIIADDLNMQAILKTMTIEEATAIAFVAGNDMIFSADFAASMKGAHKAMEEGSLTEEQVNESVKRILHMKIENGLLEVE